jgi:hypothetical protein
MAVAAVSHASAGKSAFPAIYAAANLETAFAVASEIFSVLALPLQI